MYPGNLDSHAKAMLRVLAAEQHGITRVVAMHTCRTFCRTARAERWLPRGEGSGCGGGGCLAARSGCPAVPPKLKPGSHARFSAAILRCGQT